MTPAHLATARRTPVQERSAARVERMLDAAAALLDDSGWDGLTTSSVARRAGVSVGSLYQFFPDLPALLQALARRSFGRFSAVLADRVEADPPGRWEDVVATVVDAYVAFCRREPGFRLLSFGGPVDAWALDDERQNNDVVAGALGDVLRSLLPDVRDTPGLRLALRVAVESGDAVLALAFRRDPDGDPEVIVELKRFLVAALRDLVTGADPGTGVDRAPG